MMKIVGSGTSNTEQLGRGGALSELKNLILILNLEERLGWKPVFRIRDPVPF